MDDRRSQVKKKPIPSAPTGTGAAAGDAAAAPQHAAWTGRATRHRRRPAAGPAISSAGAGQLPRRRHGAPAASAASSSWAAMTRRLKRDQCVNSLSASRIFCITSAAQQGAAWGTSGGKKGVRRQRAERGKGAPVEPALRCDRCSSRATGWAPLPLAPSHHTPRAPAAPGGLRCATKSPPPLLLHSSPSLITNTTRCGHVACGARRAGQTGAAGHKVGTCCMKGLPSLAIQAPMPRRAVPCPASLPTSATRLGKGDGEVASVAQRRLHRLVARLVGARGPALLRSV